MLCLILARGASRARAGGDETRLALAGRSHHDPPVDLPCELLLVLYGRDAGSARMERNRVKEDPGTDPDPQRKWDRDGPSVPDLQVPARPRSTTGFRKRGGLKPMAGSSTRPRRFIARPTNSSGSGSSFPDEKSAAALAAPVREALGIATRTNRRRLPTPSRSTTDIEATTFSRNENYVTLTDEARAYLTELKKEFAVTAVAPSDVTVSFEESSVGLPGRGARGGTASMSPT